MAKKLYVGGISYTTTDDGLKQAFSQAGTVSSATIIMDKFSGRSKGFGFVEFENDSEADSAVEMWNGKELDGRRLTVNEARPFQPRPAGGGAGGRRFSGTGGGGGGYRSRGGYGSSDSN